MSYPTFYTKYFSQHDNDKCIFQSDHKFGQFSCISDVYMTKILTSLFLASWQSLKQKQKKKGVKIHLSLEHLLLRQLLSVHFPFFFYFWRSHLYFQFNYKIFLCCLVCYFEYFITALGFQVHDVLGNSQWSLWSSEDPS